ncbi:MAG: tetraacyldisaccharide 4'-kinase [Bacteroides sp.]|jgi:tetraacyldisaccharide 4'-kinase|nr:tetraacyldisaccharide 4'-kinase [Bacteroides sp.]
MSPFRLLLLPFCLAYGFIAWIRNKLFDLGVIRSVSYDVPLISFGNISTGGTGKTPHVEYLVEFLRHDFRVAVLSRGYKRKTRGFLIAQPDHKASQVGDEPLQICRKFPDIVVAVHERRRKGIKKILEQYPDVNLIILDDGFQHRFVKPGLNLVLTEYYKPFFHNFLLPCGNLREPKKGIKRAHALIVSKTPIVFSPLDRNYFLRKLEKYKLENVFFSTIHYESWQPLVPETPNPCKSYKTIFLYSGIANTSALEEHLKRDCQELIVKRFPDHYQFSPRDLQNLRKTFKDTFSKSKAIVVTEKDAMRLQEAGLMKELQGLPVYFIPIRVRFQNHDHEDFQKLVKAYLSAQKIFSPSTKKGNDPT